MPSRRLDDLDPAFRFYAVELLARCVEAGIPVAILCTRRLPEEQAALLAAGRSWTTHSRHLLGRAIDIAPWEVFQRHGPDKLQWDAADPVWAQLGAIGKKLGLLWGGDWKQLDLGHFEAHRE